MSILWNDLKIKLVDLGYQVKIRHDINGHVYRLIIDNKLVIPVHGGYCQDILLVEQKKVGN